jgi:hypothetical protein
MNVVKQVLILGQCFGPATPETSLSVTAKPDSESGDARIPCIIGRKTNKKKKEKIRLLINGFFN